MIQRVGNAVAVARTTRETSPPKDSPAQEPPANTPLGGLTRFGGPYAVPITELAVGAWFAVAQLRHVADLVAPGPAQLWRAGGHGGAVWHVLAALVGAAAAVHGLMGLRKLASK